MSVQWHIIIDLWSFTFTTSYSVINTLKASSLSLTRAEKSSINTDIRTDGTLDAASSVETLTSVGKYLRRLRKWDEAKTNIISRYSSFGITADIDDLAPFYLSMPGGAEWPGTYHLGTSSNDYAYGVATDSLGNVYVTGDTYGGLDGNTSAGSRDLFLVKYNSSGTKQWTKQLGTSSTDHAYGVATDSSGNVYVTGNTRDGLDGNTNAGNNDIFLVKYNSDGVKQ